MQTSDKNNSEPAPPAWASKARAISRRMLFAGVVLIFIFIVLISVGARSIGLPSYMKTALIIVTGLGGLGIAVLSLLLRFVVLAVGYSRFSLRSVLIFVVTLATGGAFLANGIPWIGLSLMGFCFLWVLGTLFMADNRADANETKWTPKR